MQRVEMPGRRLMRVELILQRLVSTSQRHLQSGLIPKKLWSEILLLIMDRRESWCRIFNNNNAVNESSETCNKENIQVREQRMVNKSLLSDQNHNFMTLRMMKICSRSLSNPSSKVLTHRVSLQDSRLLQTTQKLASRAHQLTLTSKRTHAQILPLHTCQTASLWSPQPWTRTQSDASTMLITGRSLQPLPTLPSLPLSSTTW